MDSRTRSLPFGARSLRPCRQGMLGRFLCLEAGPKSGIDSGGDIISENQDQSSMSWSFLMLPRFASNINSWLYSSVLSVQRATNSLLRIGRREVVRFDDPGRTQTSHKWLVAPCCSAQILMFAEARVIDTMYTRMCWAGPQRRLSEKILTRMYSLIADLFERWWHCGYVGSGL